MIDTINRGSKTETLLFLSRMRKKERERERKRQGANLCGKRTSCG